MDMAWGQRDGGQVHDGNSPFNRSECGNFLESPCRQNFLRPSFVCIWYVVVRPKRPKIVCGKDSHLTQGATVISEAKPTLSCEAAPLACFLMRPKPAW